MHSVNQAGRPLRVLFLITSMEVGGAETLLYNMMSRFDSQRVIPQVACLKSAGELGEKLSDRFQVHSHLIHGKFDAWVLRRLVALLKQQRIDALVTVGAGDKMFWGRLAAWRAKVSVVLSALHSTGWPDGVGRLNRLLTPITDGFIAVAEGHRQYLIQREGFPESKVHLIPNGIDTDRFVKNPQARQQWRTQHGIPADSPVVGIVAALRAEKNHELFLETCEQVQRNLPGSHFLLVGDGARREWIHGLHRQMECRSQVHLVGNSHDVCGALSAMDVFCLTSHNEASPVSILEAMSVGLPVVAPRVGSIDQAVCDGRTGFLIQPGDGQAYVRKWVQLLTDPGLRRRMGEAARQRVLQYGSLDTMTQGYTCLIEELFLRKISVRIPATGTTAACYVPPTASQI